MEAPHGDIRSGRRTETQARRDGEAARRRKECLAACREHLVDLTILRDDGFVTPDDADEYIERRGLEPLGNAAGSLLALPSDR